MSRAPSTLARLKLATLALAAACGASAQTSDPIFGGDADPVVDDAAAPAWAWHGDLLVRRDQVNGLAGREAVDRTRARGRVGFTYSPSDAWELGAAVEAAQGSDANKDNRRNNDNERSDGANLDTAFVRWLGGESSAVTLGKTAMPLTLTPLVWDEDLRPVGVSFDHSVSIGELDRLRFAGGYFAGDHLYGDDSRIAALQAGWHWHEGAPLTFSAIVTYLDFDALDTLTREGLARTNRRVGTQLASDCRLLDAQFALHARAGEMPIELRLDTVRNLGADEDDTGARVSAVLGSADTARGFELGVAYERIERDAVMAAFNDDDWWFHSAMRGFMPWVAYGLSDRVSVRVAGFFERRDDQVEDVERLLVDVRATF